MQYGFNVSFEGDFPEQELAYQSLDFKKELKGLIESAINGGDVSIIYKHSDIIKNWFPKGGYHIFISHSHKDVNTAKYIANKLYNNYKIKSFIDSEFWGYVDEIISEINHRHFTCGEGNQYLSYEPCMRVASNFYLILADALLDAINLSDSCWFLNTSNSIHCTDSLQDATYSPWIYSELKYTSVIKRSWHPKRPRLAIESYSKTGYGMDSMLESVSASVSVEYIAPLEHLKPVSKYSMGRILEKDVNDIGYLNSDEDKPFYWLNSIYHEISK